MLPNNTNVANTNYGYGYDSKPAGPSGLNYVLDIIKLFVYNWKWFVLSLLVAFVCCRVYLTYTAPVYTRTASLMVKNDDKNKGSNGGAMGMSFLNTSIDVNNELLTLRSPNIAQEVVRRLHLDMNYMVQGRVHEACIYGHSLGFEIVAENVGDNDSFEFELTAHRDRSCQLSDFKKNGVPLSKTKINVKIGDRVKTPIGILNIKPLDNYTPYDVDLRVYRTTISYAVKDCMKKFSATGGDENSTVINLRYDDYSPERAEDALSAIIAVYNENWVKDKNQVSISTSKFIGERLAVIEQELGDVENDISDYKSSNLIPANSEEAGSRYLGDASSAEESITQFSTQIQVMRQMRNYITSKAKGSELIPANLGGDAGLQSEISQYNQLLQRRNNLLAASSINNPRVQELDQQLSDTRQSILRSIDNQISSLNTQIASAERTQSRANTKIANSPRQAKHLLSVERQQKVKESLYLYLLQKREENELNQAFTAYNTRVISAPTGSNEPTSPVEANVWLIALALGLAIPGALIFLIDSINNNVRGRRDLADLTIPFIGELPYAAHRRTFKQRVADWIKTIRSIGKPVKEDKTLHIVVKERSRNFINEAFRVVRTNIEFMSARGDKSKVIMLSSFNPNSGKTFVVTNLITSFAIKKKHVIAIDLDLRKASLSAMVNKPEEGVSDYLSGVIPSYEDVIVKGVNGNKYLDILPVGTIPPNPTELLFEDRLETLINALRDKYDYVFIDCPPVEIVADPTIVGKHVDMTLFVVRAELLDRSMLPEVQKYYDKKILPKMSIILNGTKSQFSYYGYGRYGYHRYGYGSYGSYGGYTSK